MYQNNAIESSALEGVSLKQGVNSLPDRRVSSLLPGFIKYARYELSLSPQTAGKYEECLKSAIRDIGDLPVDIITPAHFTDLKEKIFTRGAGESRIRSIVYAFKSLLSYCRNFLGISVLDPKLVKPPKHFRREVIFLTNEEIQRFSDSIKIYKRWKGKTKKESVLLSGLRFRTLVEVLLGTGMRISEVLSLNRDSRILHNQGAR
jgi:site-specific recombinase XerD